MKVTIVGVGLIGGSIGLDLRKARMATELIGVDNNVKNGLTALKLGLVDTMLPLEKALSKSNVVILSIPVNSLQTILPAVLDAINDKTIVIDTGSTKSQICKAVTHHPKRAQFVAAHPIAGTENSGPEAALQGLFRGKKNIICEKEKSSRHALQVAKKIFDALGMKTVYMEPKKHDRHVAYVSHLSHVSSFLLGQTVLDIEKDEKNIFNLAGSGFSSTVRLAKSSPGMWGPIFEQNQEYLSQALMEYIMHLQRFHYHLMKRNTKELLHIMNRANEIRRVLDGIVLKGQKAKGASRKRYYQAQ
ncbi:MAG TPA: prephenate dehydrogenase [Chitinophagales bacterium]|nr:prephenate dehydrogenase [Chitinophagales bacterium]